MTKSAKPAGSPEQAGTQKSSEAKVSSLHTPDTTNMDSDDEVNSVPSSDAMADFDDQDSDISMNGRCHPGRDPANLDK